MSTDSAVPKAWGPQVLLAVWRSTADQRPKRAAKGGDEEIGASAPEDALLLVGREGVEPEGALGAEVGGVGVADPPNERGLGLGVGGVVGLLEHGHAGDGVVGGDVGVDDAVAEAGCWLLLEDGGVGIDHEVDGAVADGVGADVDTGLVEETNLLRVDGGVGGGVAAVAGVGGGEVFVPILVEPGGASSAAAVHVDFGSAGDEAAVAEGGGRAGDGLDAGEGGAGGVQGGPGVP